MFRLLWLLGVFAAFFPGHPVFSKSGVEWAEDAWIVILADAPMVLFEGAESTMSEGDGKRQGLQATAPSVTGAARLDVGTPAARAYSDYLGARRESVLEEAGARLGRVIEPVHTFEILSNGFSVRMSADDARELAALPGVLEVRAVEVHRPVLDTGPGLVGADQVWSGAATGMAHRGEGRVIGVIDTGINWDSAHFSDQVPGYTFTNPFGAQLGECSRTQVRCNNKLVGVYDFTNEGTFGGDISGHGSHVASIAAGNPANFGSVPTSGMAPRANIVSYKVCVEDEDSDSGSSCLGDAIQAALEQAVINGVDVVNYSIGGGPNNPWTASSAQGFLNLRDAGIVGVAAAGNEGPDPLTIKTPANAPWVIGVGNSTHGRLFGNRVDAAGLTHMVSVLGNGPAPTGDISATLLDAAEVTPGNALGCSAFPGGVFNGAIALIQRGSCFFRDKVDHAAAAGAVAVLVFNNVGGLPITMDMQGGTGIPATMISLEDGLAVRAAVAQLSNPTATISAETTALVNPDWADIMAGSSSRGPNPFAERVMKPNLAAPGTNILGDGTRAGDDFAVLSGTSMATPFVAGSAVLLRQANPGWTPAMVQSALETTADQGALRNHDGRVADITARGAGRLRVDQAARAGLYLDVTRTEFVDARPPGGQPADLNLSGLVGFGCASGCGFTRRLTALRSGSWTVQTSGELDIEVTPAQFSLGTGQSVTLQIAVTALPNTVGGWADGAVHLLPGGSQLAAQKLTVGVETPQALSINTDSNRGRVQANLAGVESTPEAVFASTALVPSQTTTRTIPQDPDPDDPYDGSAGTSVIWLDVPEDTAMLYVESLPSASRDVDIFVGRDDDNLDQPAENSERCRSISPDDLELCVIQRPLAGRWWVLVQNWQSSAGGGSDAISVRTAIVPAGEDHSLSATGAGVHEQGALPVRVAWDQPGMERNDTWIGGIEVADGGGDASSHALFPVKVRRTVAQVPQHTAIIPDGAVLPVVVPGGGTHDRLFVDVPASQGYLFVDYRGESVEGRLEFMDFSGIEGSEPVTPPAPGNVVDATVNTHGDWTTLGVTSDSLQPGRYFLVLENTASAERIVDVATDFGSLIVDPPPLDPIHPAPRMGLWSPRNRSTGQGISWDRAGEGFIAWYTYEEDGSPVFYLAAGPINPHSPVWTGDMHRFTATDDVRRHPVLVGRATLTALGEEDLMFSWRIFGAHGSERMKTLASAACRDGQSLTGLWRVPGMAFGGTTVVMNPNTRAYVRYFFDDLGLPRWLITGDELGADTLAALEWRGFCPYCQPADRSFEEAGTYRIDFLSETRARERIDAVLGPPIDFDFQFDREVDKLSERMECL